MGRPGLGSVVTRLGVLSDIHGNRVALDAVLADLPPVDRVVCGGDVVGYNPWPAECVEALRDADVVTVQGNHDRAAVSGDTQWLNSMATAGIEHAREVLSQRQLEWLRSLPAERTVADDRVKLVHGHPTDPDRYTYRSEVGPDILGDEDVLVLGHTHVQFTVAFDEGVVLNPGSVGQPRDGDPRAAYSVLDLDDLAVDERRVAYDIDRVAREIDAVGLPSELGERLHVGR